ncbi:tank-1 [Symbiodinium sp. CCMP2592]|nr:tank-1 [Symbiodinium sp. CCMP2592]
MLLLTMELALQRSQVSDDLATMRAVELRARKEQMIDLAERAARIVNETAHRMGARMGLPAEWDVVERMAGTDGALLKKDEETAAELLKRVQDLVNATFWGWGGHGARTRTRDRGMEPVAKGLQVMSVIYVQNAEVFVNYRARRAEIAGVMKPDMPIGDVWDVKTASVPLAGVGRMKENPVDPKINEHYLWHGCKPEGAEGITDANFDLTRAGTAFGSLFGPGIYLAESCMKADEYTQADHRGYFPLLLCRAVLGNVLYCDHPSPVEISASLVAACGERGGHHSILGDREKVNGTFREFIVFDNHQVYPEYIVWYRRVY